MTDAVYIPSLEAKDLVLQEQYTLYDKENNLNLRRFINTLDYSLDLIKLQEVYQKVYRNRRFSTRINKKNYCFRVINVTFKYSLKEWNLVYKGKNADGTEEVLYKHYLTGETVDTLPNPNKTIYSTADLREKVYEEGFMCDGIHYVRFKRSSGSSRVGKCLFIDERLYPAMHQYEMTGLDIKDGDEVDLAALEAYIALTLSSIIGTITIDPRSILLVDDCESIFKDRVASTELTKDSSGKDRLTTSIKECQITNSLFDGESLMDVSIFEEFFGKDKPQRGCLLLRKNFFKSCCFNTNIQKFFHDHGITDISQLNGITFASSVDEIKLITTPSSIKYLKFGSFEQWVHNIDSTFGVVKYEKPTHFFDGRMVQTHYQLLNTLHLSKEDMKEFLQPSISYMELIQKDPAALKYKIKYSNFYPENNEVNLLDKNGDILSQNDMIFKLLDVNDQFSKTGIYKTFKYCLIRSMKNMIRNGHVLVNGNYSTLLGNPLEFLYHSIGQFDGCSTSLQVGEVMNIRFDDNERLLGSRSPHVTMGNVLLCTNKYIPEIDEYFNLTNEIVCINAVNDNILARLSGADYDSDTMLITNNKTLIRAAEKNYDKFPVPTCNVESMKRKRFYTSEQKNDLDIKTGKNKIGDIVNLSQDFNSLFWDKYNSEGVFDEELYCDIAQLDVMSGLEIDMAKKEFSFSNGEELRNLKAKRIRRDEATGLVIKPFFFKFLAKQKGYRTDTKLYKKHKTSMDFLHEIINGHRFAGYKLEETIPLTAIIQFKDYDYRLIKRDAARKFFKYVEQCRVAASKIWGDQNQASSSERYEQYMELKQAMNNMIKKMSFSYHTLYWLLKETEKEEYKNMRTSIWSLLCENKPEEFMFLINKSRRGTPSLVEVKEDEYSSADTQIYDYYFRHEERMTDNERTLL